MFAFGRCGRVRFFRAPVRNLVFPVRRCSELEIWRGPARSTLQFSKTALHRSEKSAWISGFGRVRFATGGQSPCSRPGPGLGSAPRATPFWGRDVGIAPPEPWKTLAIPTFPPPPLHPMPLLSCDLNTKSHFPHTQCPCSHPICTLNPTPRAPNALALMRFEHQIPLPAQPMPLL